MNSPGYKKVYVSYDPSKGYPGGRNLYYECLICGDSISSLPKGNVECRCGNIVIDVDSDQLHMRNSNMVRAYKLVPMA